MLNWKKWIYGLFSAFIGGGAGSIVSTPVVSMLDPNHDAVLGSAHFFELFAVLFVTHGLLTAAAYLQKSPLPDDAAAPAPPPPPPQGGH